MNKNHKILRYKLISSTEAHELTQKQMVKRVEWREKYKDFNYNNVIFTNKTTVKCEYVILTKRFFNSLKVYNFLNIKFILFS